MFQNHRYFTMKILATLLPYRKRVLKPAKDMNSDILQDKTVDSPRIDSTKTLREFSLFPTLCKELRLQIWEDAITDQEAQILEVYPCRDTSNHRICGLYLHHPMPNIHGLNGSYHVKDRRESPLNAQALAATNQESREEVQRHLGTIMCRQSFGKLEVEITYYILKLDTVAIRLHDLELYKKNKNPSIRGLGEIRKLLILHRCCVCGLHFAKLTAAQMGSLLTPLTSLEELYIEFDDDGPRVGVIKRFKCSEPASNENPRSLIGELRRDFEGKRQEVLKNRRQRGGSAIRKMELVRCDRR